MSRALGKELISSLGSKLSELSNLRALRHGEVVVERRRASRQGQE